MRRHKVLIIDWPWSFGDKLPGKGRGAARHYPCMKPEAAKGFELPPLAPDCLLLFWKVSSMPQEALDIVKTWGFVVKSEIVWAKLTKHGKPWIGMGHYVRASHETALVCTRGRFKVRSRSVRSVFQAKVPTDSKGRYIHSAKPPEFHAIAEELAGCKGAEVFARRHAPGWECFGNQLPRKGKVKSTDAAIYDPRAWKVKHAKAFDKLSSDRKYVDVGQLWVDRRGNQVEILSVSEDVAPMQVTQRPNGARENHGMHRRQYSLTYRFVGSGIRKETFLIHTSRPSKNYFTGRYRFTGKMIHHGK